MATRYRVSWRDETGPHERGFAFWDGAFARWERLVSAEQQGEKITEQKITYLGPNGERASPYPVENKPEKKTLDTFFISCDKPLYRT